ncbi:peptide-methionine (S)-S-oxide reductase MsrA [Lutibaculum baratangense]|uniref:Peptide methionine sulfoxide reductase MsrA n=1 Tax=Lutibaculum baratangense AMV1 TaxID=631454 RepID=V4R419_9HYPH|nr:peptide-methionine (S)-S-oxide reductase MsrA [Lutibaculum baratangense]ESR26707.1 Peptide methionine sulfoxide reductase MsrA [Lutibaculum baratangense AMV1]
MSALRSLLAAGVVAAGLGGGTAVAQETRTAIFAGGCFWCTESDFDHVEGVVATTSGYIGGEVDNPTYRQVSSGGTGHYEAVKIEYDPSRVSYESLVEAYWPTVDPLDAGGQFCDRGDQYRTAIFVADEAERQAAEASKAKAEQRLGREVVTPVLDAATFYPAEDYHQDYYLKNPLQYKFYRLSCGRDARLDEVWGGTS